MGFSRTPRLTKGALVYFDPSLPIPKVIVFQYNPNLLTRSLQPQSVNGQGDHAETFRLKGPPIETISLDIELDATDQLEHPDQNPIAATMGISPQLSALEIMLYPKSSLVLENALLLSMGTLEIIPPESPFTLFVFGSKRILPVQITKFEITEQDHDTSLNPIRAKISLGLRVLTYSDLDQSHVGYALSIANNVAKEALAGIATVSSISSISLSGGFGI